MMSKKAKLKEYMDGASKTQLKALFEFNITMRDEKIALKFNLWSRKFFAKYFTSPDASFHKDIDMNNIKAYKGEIDGFVDIAFRGGAKTARTKLFMAYVICNDLEHHRKFIKVLAEDRKNSKQIVTDIYNMMIQPEVVSMYPEIFQKTGKKREETMASFTTSTGVKIVADTVGTDQRGAIQENARPDLIWFEDFENRKSLRSAVITQSIWDNMEEARTGLSKDGSCIYTCNYISERGNVHRLVIKEHKRHVVLITPIIEHGIPTWNRYSLDDIQYMKENDDDFEGERLCQPSAGRDILFDREMVDQMPKLEPVKEIAGLRIYKPYDPGHRYASGHDISGGVGYDSSSTVVIDFDIWPREVVATFASDAIKPDIFGDEIVRHAEQYGECLVAPEKNNHGHATIGRLKQIYPHAKILETPGKETKLDDDSEAKEFGWHTNGATKPKMLFDLAKAVDNGHLKLNCPHLIREARSYTRDDVMDKDVDVRLTTRHFDLLIAAAIAWQMKDYVNISEKQALKQHKLQEMVNQLGFDPYDVI